MPAMMSDAPVGTGSSIDPEMIALLDGLPVPMVVHELGAEARPRFMNRSFTEEFCYRIEDVPSVADWARLAYPDPAYRDSVMAQWWDEIALRRATGAVARPREYRFVDKAGRERDVLIGFALQDQMVIATFQDLTRTRAAEAALEFERRQHEKTAYALTENMPAGAYTMVLRPGAALAEFGFVSRKFLQMLELTREEAEGDPMTVFARIHHTDRERWIAANAEAFAQRGPFSGETRIVANGETRWVRAESVPRELEDGLVIWEGALVDINHLKETQARLETVLRAARAFTWKIDLKAGVIEFDAEWPALHGYDSAPSRVSLAGWFDSVHPEDAPDVRTKLDALRAGTVGGQSAVYRRKHRDGHWIWLQVHAGISDRDVDGTPVALSGVSFDITREMTARAKAQEDQAQLREDLQRAQQRDTLSLVAGGVAHDLNNLIAVVSGTVDMLEMRAEGQPWLEQGLDRIRRAGSMSRDLIAGLGGLVRTDLPRGAHDLGRLLQDGVDLLGQRRIAQNGVRLLPGGEDLTVWANPTELAQVIVNLAINACDAGTQERPARVTVDTLPAGTEAPARPPDAGATPEPGVPLALFRISDTGSGVTDEVRARMFRPNFTTKGKGGRGLGLPIVSTILQGNRAALWIDSTPGGGTTMTVGWPTTERRRADAGAEPGSGIPAASSAVLSADLLRGVRVLVVDDLPDVADVLADMLEAAGATVMALFDPEEAADALTEEPGQWSVLVTDLHMAEMDGRALARHAGALSPPVPAVLVTARPDALGDGPAQDFASVLSKPVTAAQLARAVRKAADLAGAGAAKPGD
jgi:PAS domain S-box-containing protein